jgi:pimeloyl-ACP methyl ester carboxylesterase
VATRSPELVGRGLVNLDEAPALDPLDPYGLAYRAVVLATVADRPGDAAVDLARFAGLTVQPADLVDLLAEQYEKISIVGHSMGGKVAMRFALENPVFVKRLIVVDITLKAYGPRLSHLRIIEAMRKVDLSKAKTRREVETMVAEFIKEPRIRLFVLKNLSSLFVIITSLFSDKVIPVKE